MSKPILCKLGFHEWQVCDTSKPIRGHRNGGYRMENGYAVQLPDGPEEDYYPGDGRGIPIWRDCLRCNDRQIQYGGRWS